MRAELRSAARTFARALDMPDEWLTDPLALLFEPMLSDMPDYLPALDHTIIPREPLPYDAYVVNGRTFHAGLFPDDPPEYGG